MTPPKEHMSLQLLFTAGMFPTRIVGTPGTQGPAGTGVQGIGVNTPSAAAVAEATAGLAMLVHTPKGRMFTKGIVSMMFATGVEVSTRFVGSTTSDEGAAPKEHWSIAPIQARIDKDTSEDVGPRGYFGPHAEAKMSSEFERGTGGQGATFQPRWGVRQ